MHTVRFHLLSATSMLSYVMYMSKRQTMRACVAVWRGVPLIRFFFFFELGVVAMVRLGRPVCSDGDPGRDHAKQRSYCSWPSQNRTPKATSHFELCSEKGCMQTWRDPVQWKHRSWATAEVAREAYWHVSGCRGNGQQRQGWWKLKRDLVWW